MYLNLASQFSSLKSAESAETLTAKQFSLLFALSGWPASHLFKKIYDLITTNKKIAHLASLRNNLFVEQ